MKSLKTFQPNKAEEHGRAIARAMDEVKVQKEKNMARAEKRKETMLHKAANIEIGRNYS